MMLSRYISLTVMMFAIFLVGPSLADEKKSKVMSESSQNKSFIWDLHDLYPSIESWQYSRSEISSRIENIQNCKGKLGDSQQILSSCMDLINNIYKDLLKLYTFAFLAKDTDLANSEFRERSSLSQALLVKFGEATSFLNPELVAIGNDALSAYLKNSSELKDHDFYILKDII